MMNQLTLGSLFDGIGGFPLAGVIAGIKPVWAAEIEPFCVAVTKERFLDMLHYGDVAKINGADLTPVDIITFGSPCQDLSTAGKRAGLDGARSGLFMEAIRIIYEMREATNGRYPTYMVWENVPGAFTSHNGHDFKTVLSEITQANISIPASGKWANAGLVRGNGVSAAWRLLDAQYWGVPQRRKRIYLVGCFGDRHPEEILFKRDSVQRYLTPGRTPRQETSGTVGNGVESDNYIFDARSNGTGFIAQTITGDRNNRITDYTGIALCAATQQGGAEVLKNLCPTITSAVGMSGNNQPYIVGQCAGFLDNSSAKSDTIGYQKDCSPTLRAGMIPSTVYSRIQYECGYKEGFCTLQSSAYKRPDEQIVVNNTALTVRRLTPLECERLQGYPDYWTVLNKINDMSDDDYNFWAKAWELDKQIRGKKYNKIPNKVQMIKWYNKLDSDSKRYKALGNSLAIPCALRILSEIEEYETVGHNEN